MTYMFLGQPCCICIKEDNFDVKGSETDVTGIPSPPTLGMVVNGPPQCNTR